MIRDEIKKLFSDSDIDSAYQIECLPKDYPAYVVRLFNSFGVAVPYNGSEINEEFANAKLHTGFITIEGVSRSCLFLTSAIEGTRNEFAVFCEDFVDPGVEGNKRKNLTDCPVEWWKNWRQLIGNAITEKRPYAVLGELLMYEYLLQKGVNVEWEGPNSTSHDLIGKDVEYEIKSTTSRYEKIIHIAGQFQMQKTKRLFLYFCRFEQNINGQCINDVVDRLITKAGESKDELNGKLSRQGYGIGSSARDEKYQVHEILQYEVNESFPKIIPESFVGGTIPKGIEHLEYNVDLSLLDGTVIELNC